MPPPKRALIYNVIALVCAIWFLLTSWLWAYMINLIISWPVAIIGLILWKLGKNETPDSAVNKIAFWLFVAGFFISAIALLTFL